MAFIVIEAITMFIELVEGMDHFLNNIIIIDSILVIIVTINFTILIHVIVFIIVEKKQEIRFRLKEQQPIKININK